ncbi:MULTISPECIES: hypothetical protein [Erwiniaceae]|uniref:hypothetical protein n=1 Tax=Erwiniaceae TaxID=1903409 RepID=UPI00068DCCC1|nr:MULTISPECIES: hypothetical protein [Erwiniaceae]MBK0089918.1 hypothetical protein [Erwinia sp. S59]MBK0123965.1 hypothetical protein [Pantoea sp. S61]
MILSEFMLRLNRWPRMHFTAIESEQRDTGIEIYAIDCTNQTKSRLLIYRTPDTQHASAMMTHFITWLEKANRGRTLRYEKA